VTPKAAATATAPKCKNKNYATYPKYRFFEQLQQVVSQLGWTGLLQWPSTPARFGNLPAVLFDFFGFWERCFPSDFCLFNLGLCDCSTPQFILPQKGGVPLLT